MATHAQNPANYSYDDASRMTAVTQGTQTVGLGYDNAGRRTSLAYPNGVNTSYSYDDASRLTTITHQGPTALIESMTYSYDAAGNRISTTQANGTATNLPSAVQAAYDAANEQIQFNNATPNLTYDANGNLTSQTDATGTTTYTWDARNRLVAISGPTVSASFEYDALGRRTSKTINGTTTEYQYDGNDIIAEIGGEAVGATYLRSLNIDEPFIRQGSSKEYYHADALGSILVLSDEAGTAQTTYQYEAFGKTTITGTSTNPFQYTGRENDGTGVYYYRARYYSPRLERLISEDPILAPYTPLSVGQCRLTNFTIWLLPSEIRFPGSGTTELLNSYLYAKDNPSQFRDPSGLVAKPCNYLDQAQKCIKDTRQRPVGGCTGTAYGLYLGGDTGSCAKKGRPNKKCLTQDYFTIQTRCREYAEQRGFQFELPDSCTRDMYNCIQDDPSLQ
jgi:RHS repeat-associated protein